MGRGIKKNYISCTEYMVWMKVNVKGHEDRDMAVGAMLWGITGTVKGEHTLLWRSWTGKEPEGAQGLMGYGLCSTFLCSNTRTRTHARTGNDGTFTVCHEKYWLICSHITEMLTKHIKVNDDWLTSSHGKQRKLLDPLTSANLSSYHYRYNFIR